MAEKAECIGRYILSTIDSPNVIQALACDTRAHRGAPPPASVETATTIAVRLLAFQFKRL